MKKIKLILPFAALATVPAIVMPLTACNKVNYFNITLTDADDEWGERFRPYEQQTGGKVSIQDTIPNYINEFDQINRSIGRDIIYNMFHLHTHPNSNAIEMKKIEVKDCFFDTYEWRLSISLNITFNVEGNTKKLEMIISNLPYAAFPAVLNKSHNSNDIDDMYVCFAPIGGESGLVLQDKAWSIKWRVNPLQELSVLDHNSALSTWFEFWNNSDNAPINGHDCLCFRPYYYWNATVDVG